MAATKGKRVAMWTGGSLRRVLVGSILLLIGGLLVLVLDVAVLTVIMSRVPFPCPDGPPEDPAEGAAGETALQRIDLHQPLAIPVLIDLLAGRKTAFYLDPTDVPESPGIARQWTVPGPGGTTRTFHLQPEARALAFIGDPALPLLAQALTRESTGVRLQVLLAMIQIPACRTFCEFHNLARDDEDFTVRWIVSEFLRKIAPGDAKSPR